ncbi:MAG: lipoate--protein ligase family protein [Candidatus Krumholzibacteriota bacterium]|nr:lipoate--protein ligase family protein [Candidatus Krumholzibacteriota bacterium]
MNKWLYLDDEPCSGYLNMATDEFLLERVERGGGAPVLRLYSFQPPAVTIGFHQAAHRAVDVEALRRDGIDLVRRITGGRALLHDGEITYSLAAPLDAKVFGSGLRETFLSISRALVRSLAILGVEAQVAPGPNHTRKVEKSGPCLASASRYELTVRGKKIAGSAQRRKKTSFLQHGSILLDRTSAGITSYLAKSFDSWGEFITSLSEETGAKMETREVKRIIRDGFADTFGVDFKELRFSPEERARIRTRAWEKAEEFSSPAPTGGRSHDDISA